MASTFSDEKSIDIHIVISLYVMCDSTLQDFLFFLGFYQFENNVLFLGFPLHLPNSGFTEFLEIFFVFCELLYKLNEPKEGGSLEPSMYSQSIRNTSDNLHLQLVSEEVGWGGA